MSKRTIIIAVVAVLLFVAALVSALYDKKAEAEPEEEITEAEPEKITPQANEPATNETV